MKFVRRISKQLYFHKNERNALLLIMISLTIIYSLEFYLAKQRTQINRDIVSRISYTQESSNKTLLEEKSNKTNDNKKQVYEPVSKTIHLSSFDPNSISKSELLEMGLPYYGAINLIKYREKGGAFKIKDDLQKIYGLDTIYERLKPFILLPDTLLITKEKHTAYENYSNPKYEKYIPVPKIQKIIDINTATLEEFKELKGIGDVLSKRIIDFRQRLGGFVSIDQIREVYFLPDSVFIANKSYFKIENDSIRKLRLNTIDFKTLNSHPLISYKQTQLILAYRKQHESFKQIEEIQNIKAFDREFVDKILPYLSL